MPTKKKQLSHKYTNWFALTCFVLMLALVFVAAAEVLALGWGSGSFIGRLSLKWSITIAALYLTAGVLLAALFVILYLPDQRSRWQKRLISWRQQLGIWKGPMLAVSFLFLPWFVFYSPWGSLFTGFFFRLVLFLIFVSLSTALLSRGSRLIELRAIVVAGILTGSLLVIAESLVLVNDYPFALHWSEGNRLWDYSVLFGGSRYNHPAGEAIFVSIDSGRQTLWGLPFLISEIPIWAVRLWSAFLVTIPYAVLGWVAFARTKNHWVEWVLAGLWTMLFLNQGPIYTPLVLAAILVAFARRRPLWIAIPLLFIAGDYAGSSRYSWRFAPAIWAAMIAFGDAVILFGQVRWQDWVRAASLGLAGIWTKGLPLLIGVVVGLLPAVVQNSIVPSGSESLGSVENLQGLQAVTTQHPFLWERLLPNGIYPPGIVIGLSIAVGPLVILLIMLAVLGIWKTSRLQQVITVLGLGSLMVVGVIASAKAGGGTDLHNMDMFLLGLILVAALPWSTFSAQLKNILKRQGSMQWVLIAIVLIPAFVPMVEGKPLELPGADRTSFTLSRIQAFVSCAKDHGEVLLMDQRQLLTFGQLGSLPLVDEYEKKFVMNKALQGDEVYFSKFYSDLTEGRFSLIIGEREAVRYKEDGLDTIGDSLIEENNAWVTWVSIPLLDHYETVAEFKDAAIELYMPIGRTFDCP
jgi:hypothetical protein